MSKTSYILVQSNNELYITREVMCRYQNHECKLKRQRIYQFQQHKPH